MDSLRSASEETPVIGQIDLFVSAGLLLLCLITHLKYRLPLPASGLLILLGIGVRLVGRYVREYDSTIQFGSELQKELIELIFLPILIAECAIGLDWHLVRGQVGDIAILAGPAVVISTGLTAVVIKEILGYDSTFSWSEALLVGSVCSATDHISVVAILKELKAEDKLQTLMQAETLVNDGTVFVLFTMALRGSIGQSMNATELIEMILRQSLGGIGLAIVFCFCVSFWLHFLINEPIVESILTLVAAYLLFYTATRSSVDVSGGLATVVYGLYMSAYGKAFISPMVEKSVHFVWKFLGTILEGLILLICGSLIGGFIIDWKTLQTKDVLLVGALFALLYVVRAVTIIVLWPALWYFDRKMDYKKATVLIFGGLKGTISISLALIIQHHEEFSEVQRDLMLFWAIAVSGLSNTIGSLWLSWVVRLLGLNKMSYFDEVNACEYGDKLNSIIEGEMSAIEREKHSSYAAVDWPKVKYKICDDSLRKYISTYLSVLKITPTNHTSDPSAESLVIVDKAVVAIVRKRFFMTVKGIYQEKFEERKSYRDSLFMLLESAYHGANHCDFEMDDWQYLERRLLPRRVLALLKCCERIWLIGFFFQRVRFYFINCAYDIAQCYKESHKEANSLIESVISQKKFDSEVRKVIEESKMQMRLCKEFLCNKIKDIPAYREVPTFVQTNHLRFIFLYRQLKLIETDFEKGTLTKLQYAMFSAWIKRRLEIEERKFEFSVPKKARPLKNAYLFSALAEGRIKSLSAVSHRFKLGSGKKIPSEHCDAGLLLVLKGRLLRCGDKVDFIKEETIGLSEVFVRKYYMQRSETVPILSQGKSQYFLIPFTEVMTCIDEEPDLLRRMWVAYALHAIRTSPDSFDELGRVPANILHRIINDCNVEVCANGDSLNLDNGLVLLVGSLVNGLQAFAYVKGSEDAVITTSQVVVLRFSRTLGSLTRELGLKRAIEVPREMSVKSSISGMEEIPERPRSRGGSYHVG